MMETDLTRSRGVRHLLHAEDGFTLAEILTSLLLTLIVSGTALTAFVQASRATSGGAILTDLNQNLRVSMNILIRDLLQAGQGIPTGGIPIPTGGPTLPIARPGPVGADLTFDDSWTTLPVVSPGPSLGPIINGLPTDLVTLLRADPSLVFADPLAAVADDGTSIVFPAGVVLDNPATGIKPGDLIMFTNANGNAIQEVTAVSGQTVTFGTEATSGLNQRSAPQGSVLAIRNGDGSWPPTRATRVLMLTYYLTVPSNNGVPGLVRRINYGDERLIARGIDNVQLTWDIVDDATNPSNVDEPSAPNTPHQIRKSNLHMAARPIDPLPGMPLRSSVSTQVSLRSLAFVDRYR